MSRCVPQELSTNEVHAGCFSLGQMGHGFTESPDSSQLVAITAWNAVCPYVPNTFETQSDILSLPVNETGP